MGGKRINNRTALASETPQVAYVRRVEPAALGAKMELRIC